LENEEIARYYTATGNEMGTLIMRYFMSDDPETKAKALGDLQEGMGELVCLFPINRSSNYGRLAVDGI
jgi:hypothetical protein